jgi:pimeloyl-ACP methyl ester carboxylesterase
MEDDMHTVTSADGTRIAYDRYGEGPALILVNGAMGFRKFKKFEQIATALSEHCTVINYDRRGRGDSGAAGEVSVRHEVDDIAALIEAVGGQASLWGWSSGGAVALRAAAADIGVEKLVVYETPFKTDPDAKYPADDYGARLEQIVAEGDPMRAAKHFMRNGIGMPAPLVTVMSLMPSFKKFAANGLTLTFDHAALGEHNMQGRPLEAREWATVTCPTLVVYGAKTYPVLKHASRTLAEVLPNATLRELPGQNHNVSASAIVPVLARFLTGSRDLPEEAVRPQRALTG